VTDNRVSETTGDPSRRTVMSGIVGVGLGVSLLAACGSESSGGSADGGGGSGDASASGTLGTTSEVPVGGAKIFKDKQVMVSQPSKGDFKAFSTICTHQGCAIKQLNAAQKEIECNCHHSKFSITDGSVKQGPANKPLSELKVAVSGEEITVS